jgi:hypothetical protein
LRENIGGIGPFWDSDEMTRRAGIGGSDESLEKWVIVALFT